MIPRNVTVARQTHRPINKEAQQKINKPKVRIPEVVFCKAFQKDKCTRQGDHIGQYKDETSPVTLRHICAKCWLKNKEKSQHPETSEACPLNAIQQA